MPKSQKIVLGIATMWPIFYMIFFFVFVFSQIFFSSSREPSTGFFLIFPLHFSTIILTFVLLFIYINNVFRNDRIAQDKKALWAACLFMGNMISMPIYWYLYIWQEPK